MKWFEEGSGFISPIDGGPDVFVEAWHILGESYKFLYEGQLVDYEVEMTPKGPTARRVTKLNMFP